MKRFGNYILLAFLAAAVLSCGKEAVLADESIVNAPVAPASGDEGEVGQSSDEPAGEPSVSPKDDFVDNVDWSAYDNSRYLIGFGADSESAVRMSVAGQSSDEGSRVTIDPSTMWRQWDNGDEVKVYVPASGESGLYKYDSSKKQFRPKNEENVVELDGRLAYIYYPASIFSSYSEGVATVTMPAAVAYNSASDLGEKLPMAGLIPAGKDIASVLMVHFKNLSSIFRLSLTGCETVTSVQLSNADVPLAGSGSVTWNGSTVSAVPTLATAGGSTSMTVSCGDGVTLNESTPTEFYFLLPSSGSMSEVTVTVNFTQSDGTNTYTPSITKTRSTTLTLGRSQNIRYALRAGFFSGGDGSELNPYQIETPEDLQNLATYCASTDAQLGYNSTSGCTRTYFRAPIYYRQTANIDMDGVSTIPIGLNAQPFLGTYDGNSKSVSNLTISSSAVNVGMFGYCEGTIQGLTLSNSTITGTNTSSDNAVGGIAGRCAGSIANCISSSCTIRAIDNSGESPVYGNNVGGIVGELTSTGSIDMSGITAASGSGNTIEGNGAVGGVCGYQQGAITGSTSKSVCAGAGLTAHDEGLGAVSGICKAAISQCIVGNNARNNSLTGTRLIGGVTGAIKADNVTLSSCSVSYTTFSATNGYVGGVAGTTYNSATSISECSSDGLSFSTPGTAYGGILGSVASTGNATVRDCPVSNLNVTKNTSSDTNVGGVVGYVIGSLTLSGSNVTGININMTNGTSGVGGVVGRVGDGEKAGSAAISNCSVTGTRVSAPLTSVGGIVGLAYCNENISVFNCVNAAPVSGAQYVGGIIGRMIGGNVEQCRNKASVTATTSYAGGIAGLMNGGTVQTCYAAAKDANNGDTCVQGPYGVGGLVGFINSNISKAVVINCAARTNVTSTGSTGTDCRTGGLVGYLYANTEGMAVVYNSVAFERLIQNTKATATVNIAAGVGLISSADGVSNTYAVVRNCYVQVANKNLKYMNGTTIEWKTGDQYGGIFGRLVKGVVRDCYYRCDAEGKIESDGSKKNYTQITGEAKNGTEEIASLTLYNGRKLPGTILEHLYLVDALTQGSYTGTTGTTPVDVTLSRGNPKANFSEWVTYTSSSNQFAVPKVLYDLGADWYKN